MKPDPKDGTIKPTILGEVSGDAGQTGRVRHMGLFKFEDKFLKRAKKQADAAEKLRPGFQRLSLIHICRREKKDIGPGMWNTMTIEKACAGQGFRARGAKQTRNMKGGTKMRLSVT